MLSPKFGRKGQQPYQNDPYNSNLAQDNSSNMNNPDTYSRQQHLSRTQYRRTEEPQISVSRANLNQHSESSGFLASLGTLGRKKKQQEGELFGANAILNYQY